MRGLYETHGVADESYSAVHTCWQGVQYVDNPFSWIFNALRRWKSVSIDFFDKLGMTYLQKLLCLLFPAFELI